MFVIAEATLYPPEQYSTRWLLLGIACVIAVLAGYLLVFLLTRPKVPPPASDSRLPRDLSELKSHFLDLVADVERRYATGALPERDAFLQLSSLMRRFVFEATGAKAHTSTLAELRDAAPASVSTTIAGIYPGEFEPDPADVSVQSSVARVREVVSTWN